MNFRSITQDDIPLLEAGILQRVETVETTETAEVKDSRSNTVLSFILVLGGLFGLAIALDMPDRYPSYQQARSDIFEFIEIWYNRKRWHSALNYQSPVQAEQNLKHKQAA